MLELNEINIWAVVIAWIINCVIGAIWYSPIGFANLWKKYTGVDIMKIPVKEANKILISVIISGMVQALTLAIILNSINPIDALEGLKIGLLIWLGFITATTVGVTLYQRRSWGFLWLNSIYFLIVITINSLILSI